MLIFTIQEDMLVLEHYSKNYHRILLFVFSNPLLFNLYIKDVLKYIPYDCKTIQFTDDIASYSYIFI